LSDRTQVIKIAKLCLKILALLSVITYSTTLVTNAATITVGPGGSYATIGQGINAAHAGDTVEVKTGTYREAIFIYKNISVIAAPGETPVIDGARLNGYVVTIAAQGARLEGFTIQNVGASFPDSSGVVVNKDDCAVLNNQITGGYIGVYVRSGGNTVKGNQISGSALAGIYNSHSNNELTDNEVNGAMYGIWVSKDGGDVIHNQITGGNIGILLKSSHNNIRDNTIAGSRFVGIYATGSNNQLNNNEIYGTMYGIQVVLGTGFLITENNIHDNTWGLRLDGSQNNNVFLNDFVNNQISASQSLKANIFTSAVVQYVFNSNTFTGKLGNHFSDYRGTDTNGDGIGETPYANRFGVIDPAPLIASRTGYTIL